MVIGYPGSASAWGGSQLVSQASNLVPSAANGHISAVKTALTGTPLLQSDVAITRGNSGGPAFNAAGQVIGIATWGEQAQGFNFLVPTNTAMEFVPQAGSVPTPGEFDWRWAKALNLYDEGKCNESKEEFGSVLQFLPNLLDARACWRFRTRTIVYSSLIRQVVKWRLSFSGLRRTDFLTQS
jgi:hypothetical protein